MTPRQTAMAAALFLAALLAGSLVGAAVAGGGSGPDIPVATGVPIPMVPASIPPNTGIPDFGPEMPFSPVEVAAEYVEVAAEPSGVGGSGSGGSGSSGSTGGTTSDVEPDADGGDPLEDRGYPWDVEDLAGLASSDLLFGVERFPLYRFIDFCADSDDDESCPPGTGGTVLAPFDDELAIGPFDLRNQVYSARAGWWTCSPPGSLARTEHFMLLSATHPARMEIRWAPVDDPGDVSSTVVDHTDPSSRVFGDFLAAVTETGGPPAVGLHHCFVLDLDSRSRTYSIEVDATSFHGEVDSHTFTYTSGELRRRPPITVAPLSDYRATIAVPVSTDPARQSLVRLISPNERADVGSTVDCASIEDDSLEHRRSDVVPWVSGAPLSYYQGREPIGRDIVEAPDWRYDPAYDAYEFWTVNLEEGSSYRLCVWWLGSGARSFDPASASVVERETRWITTPDDLRLQIRIVGVVAATNSDVAAGVLNVAVAHPQCGSLTVPTTRLMRDTAVLYSPDGLGLCDFGGWGHPSETRVDVRLAGGAVREFLVPTSHTGGPAVYQVELDLSETRGSGLCGSSFGPCEPPTTTVPGPQVFIDLVYTDGATNGQPDWVISGPGAFSPPDRAPRALPEQIQIDTISSRVDPSGRSAMQITATFDRPVVVSASIEGDLDAQCFLGDPPTAESLTPATTHTLTLTGLCSYTTYAVALVASDPTSEPTRERRFSTGPSGDEDEGFWLGVGYTDGWHVSYQVNYANALGGDHYTEVMSATVASEETQLTGPGRCLVTSTTPFQDGVWGDEITVRVAVRIYVAHEVGGVCTPLRGGDGWQGTVIASFSIDDFRAGRIEIPVPLEPIYRESPGISGIGISVIIQGRIVR